MKRRITFYGDHFTEVYSKQSLKVQKKIEYVFNLVKQVERVPEKFFKHLTGTNGLYEIRVEYESNIFRIFCCLDEGKLVVLLNGFQKKSQQTPANELEKAKKLKEEYFKSKIMETNKYKGITSFDELLDKKYGSIGTKKRNEFEESSQMFIISEMLKEARKEANLTQEQLAQKAGTKKSYISKLENAKGNIQLATLIRIFEQGLGRRIGLTFL